MRMKTLGPTLDGDAAVEIDVHNASSLSHEVHHETDHGRGKGKGRKVLKLKTPVKKKTAKVHNAAGGKFLTNRKDKRLCNGHNSPDGCKFCIKCMFSHQCSKCMSTDRGSHECSKPAGPADGRGRKGKGRGKGRGH